MPGFMFTQRCIYGTLLELQWWRYLWWSSSPLCGKCKRWMTWQYFVLIGFTSADSGRCN